jgi:hypothetical protein
MTGDRVAAFGGGRSLRDAACAGVCEPPWLPRATGLGARLQAALRAPAAPRGRAGRKGRVVRDRSGRARYELRAKPESGEMDSLNGARGTRP